MKVGDLVELSAKGAKLRSNQKYVGGVGILMEISKCSYYTLGILWIPKKGYMKNKIGWYKRYEIKKCKADKKCP